MKIKLLFSLAMTKTVLIVALGSILWSCSKKNNPPPQKTYTEYLLEGNGSWKLQTLEFQDDNGNWQMKTIDPYYSSWTEFLKITFSSDQKISIIEDGGSSAGGSWSVNSSSISINPSDQPAISATIVTLDDATFKIEWPISVNFKDTDGVSFHAKAVRETLVHY